MGNIQPFDVAVIGGGIAGVSAAYHLAASHRVVLLEQEAELAFHTTSRSAAIFVENDGGSANRRLAAASRSFLEQDHPGLDAPLLSPLGSLVVGPEEFTDQFIALASTTAAASSIEIVDGDQALTLCPVLRRDRATIGVWEPHAMAMDAMALHQLFLRGARQNKVEVARSHRVVGLENSGSGWLITTSRDSFQAEVIVNAAGAWGDVVGELAGAKPLGLQPCRRTAFTTTVQHDSSQWPFVYTPIDGGACYFRPEAGQQLLCSLADETPSEPCDARPEEIDVALAIDHLNILTTLEIRSVNTTWAGLRTFAPDRSPVLGWDDEVANLCWMVGQGGTGIITSVASGDLVAAIVAGEAMPPTLSELGISADELQPRRGKTATPHI